MENEYTLECPVCDCENDPIDSLGFMLWYSCRDCGMWYSQEITEDGAFKDESESMDTISEA